MKNASKLSIVTVKKERTVIGLMSGTSADGVDAVIVKISGSFLATRIKLMCHAHYPYKEPVRKEIFNLFSPKTSSVDKICRMNFVLGEIFARAVKGVAKKAGMDLKQIDLIGSHGQTVYHIPGESSLQIGEPTVIAERTGIPVVADFRPRDIAVGGQGAPFVPYMDFVCFRHKKLNRVVHNIGGIANLTFLKAGCGIDDVIAFDTGPGNMVIDECVRILTRNKIHYDKNGNIAREGNINYELLSVLMKDKYFSMKPPKTTGRERYGRKFAEKLIADCRKRKMSREDIIATATELTAVTMTDAYKKFLPAGIDEIILCGGGSKNKYLVERISDLSPGISIRKSDDYGVPSDAKEAMCFALLANETVNGIASNVPSATGAKKKVILGKIIP